MRFHEEFYVSMEVNVGDGQMDSARARSSEVDRQDQRWSAYVTSAGRQDGDQERNVPAPIPSEGQEWRTQTPQSTRLTREQDWSEQVPAAVHPSETEECVSNLHSRYGSWTHHVWRTMCPIVCGIGGMKIHRSYGKSINGAGTNELPVRRRINRTVIRTSGVAGMPAMIGIWWSSWSTRGDDERWSSW